MKNIKYIFILAFASLLFGCEDKLSVNPDGDTLTADQIKEVIAKDATKLQSEVNGLYSIMKAFPATTGNDNNQDDYGIPSVTVKMEHNGQDVVGDVTGYNWYSGEQDFTTRNYTYRAPRIMWGQFYQQIRTANSIIAKIERGTTDPIAKSYMGQALAIRAYDYFNLIQLFQFTYKGNETKPGVPIVTEETADVVNNPRATVQQVYDRITDDLDSAIVYLSGNATARTDKSAVNLAVAYGLRARVNLVMQNWDDAAADAEMAITESGEFPMTSEDVSVPTFDDATAPGIIWGIIVTTNDDATTSGICNFTSMFTNLCFGYGGYTTIVGCWKKINVLLYDQIPATDVRKGWFLDENYEAAALSGYEASGEAKATFEYWNGEAYNPTDSTYSNYWDGMWMEPYTSVKFAPVNKELMNEENSTDLPLMRVSEMNLIIAEAKAMGGDLAGGQTDLETWVINFRDPDFTSSATTKEELQDEVWLQRRIEFWGEGVSWYDLMRLEKPLIRYKDNGGTIETNYGALAIFNVPADAAYRLWPIPQQEIQANDGISDADNNIMGTLPSSLSVKKSGSIDQNKQTFNIPYSLGYKQESKW